MENSEFLVESQEINTEEIMNKIKEKIQEKMNSGILKQREIDEMEDMELLPLPDFLDIPNVYQPHLYPESESVKNFIGMRDSFKEREFIPISFNPEHESGIVKRILNIIRKISFPIIRFMTRPIYNELKSTIVDLHNENKKLNVDISNEIRANMIKISDLLETIPVTLQSKEYIKLLHNTINNMIVESTKLKIEDELHKTRIKVLEDKLEFLENRERALEKKVYK